MKSLNIRLDAHQPIVAAKNSKVAYFQQSHDHVPGATLRGALAGAWIAEHGTPQESGRDHSLGFAALFEGDITYGPAAQGDSVPKPLSLIECKNRLLGELCDLQTRDLAEEHNAKIPSLCECGSPMIASKGGYGIALMRRTRTAINPTTQTAAESQLFSEQMLPPSQYTAQIHIPDDIDPDLLKWLQRHRSLRVGGGRTSLGSVDYFTDEELMPILVPPLRSQRRVVRFLSDTILVDNMGRPTYDLGQAIQQFAALRNPELARLLRLDRVWVRPVTLTGWHVASGLPKPMEQAVAAGTTAVVTGADEALALLDDLPRYGMGLRRREGYGRVVLDPEPWTRATYPAPADDPAAVPDSPQLQRIEELLHGIFTASHRPRDDLRKIMALATEHSHREIDVAATMDRARWTDRSATFRLLLQELLKLLVDEPTRLSRVTAIIHEGKNILGVL